MQLCARARAARTGAPVCARVRARARAPTAADCGGVGEGNSGVGATAVEADADAAADVALEELSAAWEQDGMGLTREAREAVLRCALARDRRTDARGCTRAYGERSDLVFTHARARAPA